MQGNAKPPWILLVVICCIVQAFFCSWFAQKIKDYIKKYTFSNKQNKDSNACNATCANTTSGSNTIPYSSSHLYPMVKNDNRQNETIISSDPYQLPQNNDSLTGVFPDVAMSDIISPLLRRAQIFVETGEFQSALNYCDRLLDDEPENGYIYFCKAMAELQVSYIEQLIDIPNFENNKSFQLAKRFADDPLKIQFQSIEAALNERERQIQEAKLKAEQEAKLKAEQAEEEKARLQYSEKLKHDSAHRCKLLTEHLELEEDLQNRDDMKKCLEYAIKAEEALFKDQKLLTDDIVQPVKEYSEQVFAAAGSLAEKRKMLDEIESRKYSKIVIISFILMVTFLFVTVIVNVGEGCSADKEPQADEMQEVPLGDKKIFLPHIEDMVYASSVSQETVNYMSQTLPPDLKILEGYIGQSDAMRLNSEQDAVFDKYIIVGTPVKALSKNVTLEEFSHLKKYFRNRFNVLLRTQKDVMKQFNQTKVKVDKVFPLGINYETDTALSASMVSAIKVRSSDDLTIKIITRVGALSLLLIKNKIIFIYVYKNYESENDLEWIKETAKKFSNEIITVNQ